MVTPTYFLLKYAIIKSIDSGFIPFNLYEYQKEALKDLVKYNLIVILKNRQVGWTWLIAGYALWKAIFFKAANIIIISKGQDEAAEVLDYCRFMYDRLPDFLKPEIDRNRTGLISFPEIGSKIRALSAQTSSGIGFGSASLVILDENDFHPYAEENYIEIKPMIDAGGNRQLIILSAPNRRVLNSSFKNIWGGARRGENNFHPILTSFGAVPFHTDEWLEDRRREYTPRVIETRYFKTEEEALSVTSAGKFFDGDKMKSLSGNVINPLEGVEGLDIRNGVVKVFKPRVPGDKYISYCDPSMGKDDPSHIVVIRSSTQEEVCNVNVKLPADEVATIFDEINRYYNNAFNSYESNAIAGGTFKTTLNKLDTPNQMTTRNADGKLMEGQHGLYMTNPLKKAVLGHMRTELFNLSFTVHDAPTIDEFGILLWEEGEDMPEVPGRAHDDRIMAWAGVLFMNKYVRDIGTFRAFTVKYGG